MSHRFFAELTDTARARLPSEEAEHALKVLRLKSGDEVELLDASAHAYKAQLDVAGAEVYADIIEALPSREAPVEVTLFMGIPKGEKLELIAQKLTELGAKSLYPVRMTRCVAKIEDKEADKKLQRPRRIAQEAQKQCGRAGELEIPSPIDIKALCAQIRDYDAVFLLWEEARSLQLKDCKAASPELKRIAYIVGPEGGITCEEANLLTDTGAQAITLGPRILRAETAAVAGCAAIMTLWGDL